MSKVGNSEDSSIDGLHHDAEFNKEYELDQIPPNFKLAWGHRVNKNIF